MMIGNQQLRSGGSRQESLDSGAGIHIESFTQGFGARCNLSNMFRGLHSHCSPAIAIAPSQIHGHGILHGSVAVRWPAGPGSSQLRQALLTISLRLRLVLGLALVLWQHWQS